MRFVWASALGMSLLLAPTITKAQLHDKPTTATGTATPTPTGNTRNAATDSSEPTTAGDPPEQRTSTASTTNVALPEEKTWSTILIIGGAGISTIGAIIGGAAYAAQVDYAEASNQHYRSAKSWGCWGGAQACAQYNAALDASDKAHQVVLWATLTSTIVGTALFGIGVIGAYSSPVQVQVAPTLGGATLRAQF